MLLAVGAAQGGHVIAGGARQLRVDGDVMTANACLGHEHILITQPLQRNLKGFITIFKKPFFRVRLRLISSILDTSGSNNI